MAATAWLALAGSDRGLRRMLQYWAATALLYLASIGMVEWQVLHGFSEVEGMRRLELFGIGGIMVFYFMVRFSAVLRLTPEVLTVTQALYAIGCGMWAYSIGGPVRSGIMPMTVMVVAFCMFALRPRQTLLLTAASLTGMGSTMWWLQAHDPLRFPPAVEAITFGYLAAALLSTALLTGEMSKLRARLKRRKKELERALETIRLLATRDELTSLANRRHMNEVLAEEERRHPHGAGTCVALLDIDFFKQVNDRHGHAAGDAVLRSFAATARGALRGHDVLARWGGEEFLLLLPDTCPSDARLVLDRMAERVHAMRVPALEADRRISFSAGLAERRHGEAFADAINRADKALYRAKEAGRDRIEMA
ncbi:diguanylate cyclase [Massilia sp. DD77]|uniref:diguanylate cyclase n=1 Tax=Massilia sp. DD77 TaxID=3109349 RepID=UPI002FFFB38D